MMIIAIILLCSMAFALVFFLISSRNLASVRKEFINLAKIKAITFDQKLVDMNSMRLISSEINTEESRVLLIKAEGIAKKYLISFRALIFFVGVSAVVALFSKP